MNAHFRSSVLLALSFVSPIFADGIAFLGVRLEASSDRKGATVAGVMQPSPAHEAGLLRGDIILAVDDQPTNDSAALVRAIRGMNPGSKVAIRVLRSGKERSVAVTLGGRQLHHDFRSGKLANATASKATITLSVQVVNAKAGDVQAVLRSVYRDLIEQNPDFDITSDPAVNTVSIRGHGKHLETIVDASKVIMAIDESSAKRD